MCNPLYIFSTYTVEDLSISRLKLMWPLCEKQGQKRPLDTNERKIERRERDKIEIDTHLFVKRNQQIKPGCFRQNITRKVTI